ncbi:MAG TPA: calcium-translocating P-type ATPase, PMCA-type [Methylothermaceae bacterium]|nr:calcium-translocating P-type ATPase, PMCA-type [Methylothermaceae bacterium]
MTDIFTEIAAILVMAAVFGALGAFLRQPLIIAYIAVGVVAGPAVLGWVQAQDQVDLMARLGITLLLFVVGLKLDVHLLKVLGWRILIIGLIQVAVTGGLGYGLALILNFTPLHAAYLGLALAFSSTVVIVKLLSDRGEIDALHGRAALGILLVQDLVVVLAMVALTTMEGELVGLDLLWLPVRGAVLLIGIALLSQTVLPKLFQWFARYRELLMLTALAWALLVAVVSHVLGFSHEVGAFVAGVALASTPYREAVGAKLTALRDFLLLFFFVDLGARLLPEQLIDLWPAALALIAFSLLVKPVIIMALLGLAGFRRRTLGLAGLVMGQISEFSLILAAMGAQLGHLGGDVVALLTLVALITITLSGYVIDRVHGLYETLKPWLAVFERQLPESGEFELNHVSVDTIVFGLGRYGGRIALGLQAQGWQVLGVDFDPDQVALARQRGLDARYLDAEDPEMIAHLPLKRVRWVVSAIRDLSINRALLQSLRQQGFQGSVAVAADRLEDSRQLEVMGVDLVLLPYQDAADRAVDLLTGHERRLLALDDGREIPLQEVPWHALPVEEVLQRLQVDPAQGLSEQEAAVRCQHFGPNRLLEKPPASVWQILLRQFKSLLILILIGAAGLAWAIGELTDALVILVVVFINALLGFYQEYRAEQSLAVLKKMLVPEAEVRRSGKERMIPATEIVPGDIVIFDAGDRVPADGRLIQAHNLQVDESSLTGESHPATKIVEPLPEELPLADRRNMLYMNTSITRGRAEMVVTAIGMETEIGQLAAMLAQAEEAQTPLQIQLDGLGKRLAALAGMVVVLMLSGGWLRGQPWTDLIFTAVALAVASIPEGLPAVVTVTLAMGLHRMARKRAIVKRLAAVETLGCTSVICSDKTGTLTLNQMTARALYALGRTWRVSGEGYDFKGKIHPESGENADLSEIILPFAVCNDAKLADGRVVGDPMEGALLVLAAKAGLALETVRQAWQRVAEIPFDTAHKFMATFHRRGERIVILVKGAPEVLIEHSTQVLGAKGIVPLTPERRQQWLEVNRTLASRGLRILASARREMTVADFDSNGELLSYIRDLTLLGLVGLMDPPRPEAKDAIDLCKRAGIGVKMITGDQPVTAAAIGQELGLTGELLVGTDLDHLSDAQLTEQIENTAIFARTTPQQKVRIVKALKAHQHIVAMTGDGVNDAPALKSADIGIAMGITGTDVAKEAATMILTDDNFATIVGAVKEGRTIYDNILKFVRFQLSTNIGAILSLLIAPFLGLPLPLNPIQILWINIIMDGPPAMALGIDPPRPSIMDEPPRSPKAQILNMPRLLRLLFFGLIMTAGTLGILWWGLENRNQATALTMAFTTFVWFQLFNVFNARMEHRSVFNRHSLRNRWLWLSLFGVVLLQWFALESGTGRDIFHTVHLSTKDWGLAVIVASSVLVAEELRKAFYFFFLIRHF